MKRISLLFLVLCFSHIIKAQTLKIDSKSPFNIGETVSFTSEILNEKRTLNIYLPQSYKKDTITKYPVIYLLDGSADEDFIHISGLVQFGSFSWINMLPESIVVGISNIDRKKDFTYPSNNALDKKDFPTSGGSENFIRFLEMELQPLIAANYNISEEKTIIGQSLGGLLAAEILIKKPSLFNNYIIVSPSMWWDDESLLSFTPKISEATKKIFIGVGKEGPIMEESAMALYLKMRKTYRQNPNIHFKFFPEQDHGDTLHQAVYEAFASLFKEKKNKK
ncbi:esterase [Patiriisocius marinistellae]|uniref:Esterase n=1 Tax=Patiriisocius marinistellae TaxID=2494560 RepID=A0A5J4G2N0_9FLAO|nr:alpha/beta hydrolase-fold protein [Patiriisocius marinistellae]GEQ87109.1 esterase [Patiriisocius marinistellae]